ncbi:MAG: prepilin peptidase [Sulfurimonas sp.]
MLLVYFIIIASIISAIDYKKRVIPDKIILPAIAGLIALKAIDNSLKTEDFIAAAIVAGIFILPIVFGMAFGGGDIRYGVFCALFLGLEGIGIFIALSGVYHLIVLAFVKRKVFGFAPAMSLGALSAYIIGNV